MRIKVKNTHGSISHPRLARSARCSGNIAALLRSHGCRQSPYILPASTPPCTQREARQARPIGSKARKARGSHRCQPGLDVAMCPAPSLRQDWRACPPRPEPPLGAGSAPTPSALDSQRHREATATTRTRFSHFQLKTPFMALLRTSPEHSTNSCSLSHGPQRTAKAFILIPVFVWSRLHDGLQ